MASGKMCARNLLSDSSGHIRMTLLGSLACTLLAFGFILLLNIQAQAGLTSLSGSNSCISTGCHVGISTGTITTAANGTAGTTATANAGGTFEADWKFSVQGNKSSVGPMIIVPSGWTASAGTANSTGLSGWHTAWNAADGVASGWSQNCNATGDGYSGTTCYSVDYAGTPWDAGSRNTARDDATAGDLDGTPNSMGTDATVTIPAATTPGTYSVILVGGGHDGNSRTHVKQTLTVTVKSAVTSTSPNSMPQSTGPTTVTINGAGFTNTGLSVSFSGTGVSAGTATYVSATQITVPVTVTAGAAIGARDVTVTCSGQSGTGTGVFSVTAALTSTTTTVTNPTAITYGQSASFTATVNPSAATGTIQFKVDGANVGSPVTLSSGSATLSGVTGLQAGNRSVTAVYSGDASYATSTSSAVTQVVDPATPTASIINTPVTYSGSAQTATVACLGGGTATLASGGTGTTAGSYPATVNCAASANYSAASGLTPLNNPFVINKAAASAAVSNSPQVYDGSAKTIAVTCTGGGASSNITPASQTNVGIYPVTADCASSTNYNAGTGLAAGNFQISAATQTASVTNSPVIFNTSPQAAAVTCSGAGVVSNVRYNGSGTVPADAATYAIVVDCAANGGFSATSNVSAGNFTINPADQTIGAITFTPTSLAVSGTTTASATATSGLAVTFSSDTPSVCTVNVTTVTGVSAGTCTVRAAQVGDGNYNAAPDVTQSIEVTSGNSTVTVTMTGSGSGTINSSSIPSSPDGITCPGDCSGTYTGGTEVTLMATPDWKSDFVSWTVGCTGTGTNCIFTPDGDTGVTATFNFKQLVMMPGPTYFATIQDAYNAALDGAVLQGRDQTFTEDLVFDRAVNLTFNGGYNDTWTLAGDTTINGTVTMAGWSVTVSNLIIQ